MNVRKRVAAFVAVFLVLVVGVAVPGWATTGYQATTTCVGGELGFCMRFDVRTTTAGTAGPCAGMDCAIGQVSATLSIRQGDNPNPLGIPPDPQFFERVGLLYECSDFLAHQSWNALTWDDGGDGSWAWWDVFNHEYTPTVSCSGGAALSYLAFIDRNWGDIFSSDPGETNFHVYMQSGVAQCVWRGTPSRCSNSTQLLYDHLEVSADTYCPDPHPTTSTACLELTGSFEGYVGSHPGDEVWLGWTPLTGTDNITSPGPTGADCFDGNGASWTFIGMSAFGNTSFDLGNVYVQDIDWWDAPGPCPDPPPDNTVAADVEAWGGSPDCVDSAMLSGDPPYYNIASCLHFIASAEYDPPAVAAPVGACHVDTADPATWGDPAQCEAVLLLRQADKSLAQIASNTARITGSTGSGGGDASGCDGIISSLICLTKNIADAIGGLGTLLQTLFVPSSSSFDSLTSLRVSFTNAPPGSVIVAAASAVTTFVAGLADSSCSALPAIHLGSSPGLSGLPDIAIPSMCDGGAAFGAGATLFQAIYDLIEVVIYVAMFWGLGRMALSAFRPSADD